MKSKIILLLSTMMLIYLSCSKNTTSHQGEAVSDYEIHSETEEPHDHDIDHTVLTITKQPFTFVLLTSGRIMVDTKDIIYITAKSSGIIKFTDHFLFPGVKISNGQQLFTISGEKLSGDNSELSFSQAKADLDQAKSNYERAQKLIVEKIITEEHFLSLKNSYEKALNEFNNLNGAYGKNGISISSPENGYIREVFITEGQKVSPGQNIASMVMEDNIVLKADISPDYLQMLPSIENANFKVGYSNHLYKSSEMNGRKISSGKSTGENSFYLPVYFRLDYDPSLIEGTFAEVYLIGKQIEDAIIVPNTALLEEYGKLYVYVEDFDGDFLKRYITPGYNNGEYTQVLNGLSENETIVATGAYTVKLSQMTTSEPAHNH